MSIENDFDSSKSVFKANQAANFYVKLCPTIARHYASEASFLNRMIGFKEKSSTFACNYCFTLWTAEDVKVRFKKKKRKNVDKLCKEMVYKCVLCGHSMHQSIISRNNPATNQSKKQNSFHEKKTLGKKKSSPAPKEFSKKKKKLLLQCLMDETFKSYINK